MKKKKLPNSRSIYILGVLSCLLFYLGGMPIIFAFTSLLLAKKNQRKFTKKGQMNMIILIGLEKERQSLL